MDLKLLACKDAEIFFFYDLILSCSAAFSVKPHNILIAHRPFHRQLEEGAGQLEIIL